MPSLFPFPQECLELGKTCYGQEGLGSHVFVTAPCSVAPQPPGLRPVLVLVTHSVPAPHPSWCVVFTVLHYTAVLDGGGAPLRECGGKGAALFVAVFFVLSQSGRHGMGEGLIHSPAELFPQPLNCICRPTLPS